MKFNERPQFLIGMIGEDAVDVFFRKHKYQTFRNTHQESCFIDRVIIDTATSKMAHIEVKCKPAMNKWIFTGFDVRKFDKYYKIASENKGMNFHILFIDPQANTMHTVNVLRLHKLLQGVYGIEWMYADRNQKIYAWPLASMLLVDSFTLTPQERERIQALYTRNYPYAPRNQRGLFDEFLGGEEE